MLEPVLTHLHSGWPSPVPFYADPQSSNDSTATEVPFSLQAPLAGLPSRQVPLMDIKAHPAEGFNPLAC